MNSALGHKDSDPLYKKRSHPKTQSYSGPWWVGCSFHARPVGGGIEAPSKMPTSTQRNAPGFTWRRQQTVALQQGGPLPVSLRLGLHMRWKGHKEEGVGLPWRQPGSAQLPDSAAAGADLPVARPPSALPFIPPPPPPRPEPLRASTDKEGCSPL